MHGQTFSKRYDWFGELEGESSYNIEPISEGYIIGRVGDSPNNGIFWRIGFLGIDNLGDQIFENSFFNDSVQLSMGYANSGEFRPEYGYMTAGSHNPPELGRDAMLIKYNEQGDTLWTTRYGQAEKDYASRQGIFANDGGYALTGFTNDFPQANSYDYCQYLIKLSPSGDFAWIQKYIGEAGRLSGYSLDQLANGNFILGGTYNPLGNGNSDMDHLVILTDSLGNEIWRQQYGDVEAESGAIVRALSDGNILLVGPISDADSPVGGHNYLAKIDVESGDLIWDYRFLSLPATIRSLYTSLELDDGSLVAAGLIERPDPTGTFGVHHGMICKLTSEGDSLWVRKYAWDDENFIGGFFRDMTTTPEGGFICTGTAYWSEDHPSQDTWVMKVDEYGCLVPGCHVGVIEKDQNLGFELYPNPANDVLSAYIESKKTISGRFTLYNGSGQAALIGSKVMVSPHESVTHLFDVAHLPRGFYVLRFTTDNGQVISKKVVLN